VVETPSGVRALHSFIEAPAISVWSVGVRLAHGIVWRLSVPLVWRLVLSSLNAMSLDCIADHAGA